MSFPRNASPLSNWHPWPVSGGEIKWRISRENNINLAHGLSKVCVLSRRKTDRKVVQSAAGTGPNAVDITPGGTCLAGVAFGAAKKGAFSFGGFFFSGQQAHHITTSSKGRVEARLRLYARQAWISSVEERARAVSCASRPRTIRNRNKDEPQKQSFWEKCKSEFSTFH